MTTAASMGVTRVVAGTSTWTFTRGPDGTLVDLRYGGASYWYLFDGQGSVIGLTDANGNLVNSYRYDPYGKRLAATEAVPNPFQFHAGATFTGGTTYKYGTRWYDTTTGTWTQLDPTGADPGYTYTGGDPINRTDPSGRWFGEDLWEEATDWLSENWASELAQWAAGALAGVTCFAGAVGLGFTTAPLTGGTSVPVLTTGASAVCKAATLAVKYGVEQAMEG